METELRRQHHMLSTECVSNSLTHKLLSYYLIMFFSREREFTNHSGKEGKYT